MRYPAQEDDYDVDIFNQNFAELSQGIWNGAGGINGGMFSSAVITRRNTSGEEMLEYWFFVNARHDPVTKRFKRINVRLNSFGIQYLGKGTYPGEEGFGDNVNQSIGYWRATGKAYFEQAGDMQTAAQITEDIGYDDNGTWREFGVYVGWNNCYMLDSYGGMTVGGAGLEIDGNGMWPFSRVSLSKFSGGSSEGKDAKDYGFIGLGLLWNAFHGLSASDNSAADSYFFGMKAPIKFEENGVNNPYSNTADLEKASVAFMRRRGGNPHAIENWQTVFEVTADGKMLPKGNDASGPPLINNLLTNVPGLGALDAAQGKALNDRIGTVDQRMGGFEFSVSSDGIPMYKPAGADTALPFKRLRLIRSGLSSQYDQTVDVSAVDNNYQKYTSSDFLLTFDAIAYGAITNEADYGGAVSFSYNPATGRMSIPRRKYFFRSGQESWVIYSVYLV